ncbi:MAG TPA: homocysteine S-methyltransferase family protein, partial [Anaerolineales bacterium]
STWITFTARDERHISEGQVFAECAEELDRHSQVAAIGINCTSPTYIPSLIREARNSTTKPVIVYPNSGETYNAANDEWNDEPVLESFGEQAREWYKAGARLIGGCCRTTPEDIHVIANWARQM